MFDGRGNGRSDRPVGLEYYAEREFAEDALAVLDTVGIDSAVIVSLSLGAQRALLLAGEHAERVGGCIFIAPAVPMGQPLPERAIVSSFNDVLESSEGWAKYNRHYWLRNYRRFLEFFFSRVFTEPNSARHIAQWVKWGLETTPETLIDTHLAPGLNREKARELASSLGCPVLVVQGTADAITGDSPGRTLAEITGGDLLLLEGAGHAPHFRHPETVNRAVAAFLSADGLLEASKRLWDGGVEQQHKIP